MTALWVFEEAPDLGELLVDGLDPLLRLLLFAVDLLDQALLDLVLLGREDLADALFDVVEEGRRVDPGFCDRDSWDLLHAWTAVGPFWPLP